MATRNRRQFLNETFSACGSFGITTAFGSLASRMALAENTKQPTQLLPTADAVTGLNLMRLPEGFWYQTFGWTKDPMQDGLLTPPEHDGMGVVKADGSILTLVRNHEISNDQGAPKTEKLSPYDLKAESGCTTLRFDSAAGKWIDSQLSIGGTSRNCAGGVTPWGTWLTCEETVLGPDSIDRYKDNVKRGFAQEHGWIFEVDPSGVEQPVPLKDMGRFVHEAVAIDKDTGIVYETEDRTTAGFYRFIPNKPGNLSAGGTLEVAEAIGAPDLRGGVPAGSSYDIRWHKIADPTMAHSPGKQDPDELGVYTQGKAMGATTFARLEGCWYGNGKIYFDATSGGAAKAGQIWIYDPAAEKLTLMFESPAKEVLNMPDNLCVRPQGGLILCEDNDYGVDEYPQRMFALNQSGKLRLLAENSVVLNGEKNGFKGDFRNKEWAGATFSPDGKWLFVNLQTPGITCAITGPWEELFAG